MLQDTLMAWTPAAYTSTSCLIANCRSICMHKLQQRASTWYALKCSAVLKQSQLQVYVVCFHSSARYARCDHSIIIVLYHFRWNGILICQTPSWGGSLGMPGVTEEMVTEEWLRSWAECHCKHGMTHILGSLRAQGTLSMTSHLRSNTTSRL